MVKFYVGDQQNVTFRYESGTYGTASGANNWIGIVISHEPGENTGVKEIRYAGTYTRGTSQFLDGPLEVKNTLNYYPQDFKMLKFVLGSCVDGGSPSPFQHNYLPNQNNASCPELTTFPLAPFTIVDEKNAGIAGSNFVRTYNGCIADSWTLSIKQGEPVSCQLSYVAQTPTFSSGAVVITSGTDSTRPYMWRDCTIRIPSGTSFNEITEATLTVGNTLATDYYLDGNRTIGQPVPGNLDVQIAVTLNATAERTKELYDQYFLGGSMVNMIIDLNQSTGSEQAIFTISGAKMMNFVHPSTVEGVHKQTLMFKAGSIDVQEFSLNQYNNFGSYAGF